MDNRYKGIVLWKSFPTSEYSATSNVQSNEWYFVPRKGYDRSSLVYLSVKTRKKESRNCLNITRRGLKRPEMNLSSELAGLLIESRNTSKSVNPSD